MHPDKFETLPFREPVSQTSRWLNKKMVTSYGPCLPHNSDRRPRKFRDYRRGRIQSRRSR